MTVGSDREMYIPLMTTNWSTQGEKGDPAGWYPGATYDYPPVEGYPPPVADAPAAPPRAGIRWVWAAAALVAAAAALVAAGAYGFHAVTTPAAAPAVTTTVTLLPPDRNAGFLSDLDRAGINYSGERGSAVHNAYVVCVGLGSGMSEDDVAQNIAGYTVKTGLPETKTAQFVKIAIAHYCPDGHL